MSKKRQRPVDDDIIDVDAIVNGEYDVDVDTDTPIKMIEDEPETVEDFIEKIMARQQKSVNDALKVVNKRIAEHDSRIISLEKQQKEIMEMLSMSDPSKANVDKAVAVVDDQKEEPENRNIVDKTLGAVGGVMHGIVDTAAFVLESTVDLVTLGRAKRDY